MTTREFYTSIINYIDGQDMDAIAIQEFAKDALAKLDARNEKARSKPRKADPAVTARKEAIGEFLATHEGEYTADEIAEILGLTAPQVSAAMRTAVAMNLVTKGTRKIDSKHSKVTYVIVT